MTALALVLLGAAPASAHTVSGGGATDYTSSIVSVSPATPGLSISIIENSSRFELTNRTGQDVTIAGYDGEPYLRVLADGTVQQNRLSPSVGINAVRQASQAVVPSYANPDAAPEWVTQPGTSTVRWHEHVLHEPEITVPAVRAHPDLAQRIATWTVTMTVGTTPTTVAGVLNYQPGPSSTASWAVVAVALLATLGLLLLGRWLLALAATAVVLVGVDLVQSVGVSLVRRGQTSQLLVDFANGNGVEAVAWVLGLVGARLLLRKKIGGAYLVGVSGAVIGAVGGLGNLTAFTRSSAPFQFGIEPKRIVVALSIGLGAGLLLSVPVLLRRLDPLPPRRQAIEGPTRALQDEDRTESAEGAQPATA